MPLNREDMDFLHNKCEECADETLPSGYLHSRCHHDVPTWASYDPKRGVLKIECAKCHKTVAEFYVKQKGN